MKRIPRRIFQEEFKREAIKLVNEQGLTISEACKKLDIATKSLRTWMKQEQNGELKSSLGANKLTADQLRIRELERELSIAKTERDILMALALGHLVGHPEKRRRTSRRSRSGPGPRPPRRPATEIRHDRSISTSTSRGPTVRIGRRGQEWLPGLVYRQSHVTAQTRRHASGRCH